MNELKVDLLLTKLHLPDLQEVDEETLDNASACLTGPLDDNSDNVGSSAADINSIAEERYSTTRTRLGATRSSAALRHEIRVYNIYALGLYKYL